ncbi:MAG: RusA family crossover junction endodeoxyribonuclease, partial [Alphaproteobacteria bacterium]|nr:RusA family crossover junction endodeoxyribonuclease [Alphaproteobacteria bacterium]
DGLLKHTVKPDLDNLTKALLDALNDIAWHDDAQIVDLQIRKEYTTGDGYIDLYIRQLT